MNKKIKPTDFTNIINSILEEFGDEMIGVVDTVINDAAVEATRRLKDKSSGDFKDITGKYRASWKYQVEKKNLNVEATVYSDKQYRLTHLLEFGHAKQNGGRTKAFPHISIVNDWVEDYVIKELTERM